MKNNKHTFKLIDLDVPVKEYFFNRVFPKDVVKQFIESQVIQEKIDTKSLFCGLTSYSHTSLHKYDLNFTDVWAVVKKMYIDDSQLKIDVEVLDTPMGKVLKELLNTNPNIIKCLPIFEGNYSHDNPEVIKKLELRNIYFIA